MRTVGRKSSGSDRSWAMRAGILALSLGVLGRSSVAFAEEESLPPPPEEAETQSEPLLRPEWRKVAWPEYVAASLLIAAPRVEKALLKPIPRARWKGPILFDTALHNGVRASSSADRDFAQDLSDNLLWAGLFTNFFLDPVIVAGFVHQDPFLAWQMIVINAEVLGLVSLATRMTKRLSARERPYGQECEVNPSFVPNCDSSGRYQSFFSGHTSTSGTLAGLNCAHHLNLALYGNRMADVAACAGSSALMVMTGAMRLVSSNHWGTDIVVGGAVGFATGYLAPSWLYYNSNKKEPTGRSVMALPIVSPSALGLAVTGTL